MLPPEVPISLYWDYKMGAPFSTALDKKLSFSLEDEKQPQKWHSLLFSIVVGLKTGKMSIP